MSDEPGGSARDDASPRDGDGASSSDGDEDAPRADGDSNEEGEWRFSLDEVGPEGVTEDTATPDDEPIEPGDVDLEHAVFVVLGVALTVGLLLVGF